MILADPFEQDIFKCRLLSLVPVLGISLFPIASLFNYIVRVLSLFIVDTLVVHSWRCNNVA